MKGAIRMKDGATDGEMGMFRKIVKYFGPEWGAAAMGTAALSITMQLSSEVARPFSSMLYIGLGFYLLATVLFLAFLVPWLFLISMIALGVGFFNLEDAIEDEFGAQDETAMSFPLTPGETKRDIVAFERPANCGAFHIDVEASEKQAWRIDYEKHDNRWIRINMGEMEHARLAAAQ
jgi:hypothetical protein